MAAFTVKDPADRQAFTAYWNKILGDEGITIKTILFEGGAAGSILSHVWIGEPEVSFWFGKENWGKGITTEAIAVFLDHIKRRPLNARAAKDNSTSIRVLEKCGFTISGYVRGFANGSGEEIEEVILKLG